MDIEVNNISPSRLTTVSTVGTNWPTNGKRKLKKNGLRQKKF
jgi:hypothetical protein